MRPSRRDAILDAAYEVIQDDGIAAVTFESVADAAGLTKGGLVYHFRSKDDLLVALHERRAALWEASMLDALVTDGDAAEATADERLAAYVKVGVTSATGPELLLMLEASVHPELKRPWSEVAARWLPDPTTVSPDDPSALTRLLAAIAADGLWLNDSIGDLNLPAELRAPLVELVLQLLADAPP